MEIKICAICSKNKTALRCDTCGDTSCKKCSHFIDEESFELIDYLSENLRNKTFCPNCYNGSVGSELEEFQDILERARKVDVYSKDQGKETRLIRRVQKPIHVKDCDDREETLLRLAFLAAQKGFGTIVDVELKYKKVSGGGTYQKVIWDGTAVPV